MASKKLIAILAAVLLMAVFFSVTAFAEEGKNCNHQWKKVSWGITEDCTKLTADLKCSKCGAKEIVFVEPEITEVPGNCYTEGYTEYSGIYTYGNIYKDSLYYKQNTGFKHTFSPAVLENGKWHLYTCTECGFEEFKEHVTEGEVISFDENGHYENCTECGAFYNEHSFETGRKGDIVDILCRNFIYYERLCDTCDYAFETINEAYIGHDYLAVEYLWYVMTDSDGNPSYICGCSLRGNCRDCGEFVYDYPRYQVADKYNTCLGHIQLGYGSNKGFYGIPDETYVLVIPNTEKDPDNHILEAKYEVDDSSTHTLKYECCGAAAGEKEFHTYDENGICICGYFPGLIGSYPKKEYNVQYIYPETHPDDYVNPGVTITDKTSDSEEETNPDTGAPAPIVSASLNIICTEEELYFAEKKKRF